MLMDIMTLRSTTSRVSVLDKPVHYNTDFLTAVFSGGIWNHAVALLVCLFQTG